MNLIANTGIHYFTCPLEIDANDTFKMFFHESFDIENEKLSLEIAHYFSEEDVWVKKHDLFLLGYLTKGKVGRYENERLVPYKWDDIKTDFYENGKSVISPMESMVDGTDSFSLNKCRFEKFENKWLPMPFFNVNYAGNSEFGPTNWCRFKLIPVETDKRYQILLAFDTRTLYENEDFEDDDLMEFPVFASTYDKSKDFAICNNEFSLVDFCSKARNCEWVDNSILKLFHPNVNNLNGLKIRKPKLNYLAQYIFLLNYIQNAKILPTITLFSDNNIQSSNVDLVLDIGNSRTCAVLFDDSDFTKVEHLGLFNFTNPIKNGKLNRVEDSFDMRLVFSEVVFGDEFINNSNQFVYPSMVRLGDEAKDLIYKAKNLNTGSDKISTFSSPKRYLWDDTPQEKEWEFISVDKDVSKPIWIKGINEQLKNDGSLNTDGSGSIFPFFSRKSLMTLSFIEILSQATLQINSYEFRKKWGRENTPRKISRIIISCPTAMSREEQIALRKCAEDAHIILKRFYNGTFKNEINEREERSDIMIIPSAKNLSNTELHNEWIYDEATSSQFVYLFAEVTKRYRNNCDEFFKFYGKHRNDLDGYNKKSLTVGTVDIGAGTTDLMICAYKYDSESQQCILTPVPLFWESFYIAGDDLLQDLIRKLIIEGKYAAIQSKLIEKNAANLEALILDYFGIDNARLSVTDRQMRSEFNLQVSVPIVSHFLKLLNENKIEKAQISFDDIFPGNKPSERVLNHFKEHFSFGFESINWNYDKSILSEIVQSKFEGLVGKISSLLSYYNCDIVLLSGRPSSLKPIADLFLKYFAVSPNRLITLNDYRIGTWYPFQNGKGYFKDAKSIVAVGAMIGNYASTRGNLEGFTLDFSDLQKKLLPTTEYICLNEKGAPFITPTVNNSTIQIVQLPIRFWTRQLDTPSYPTRPFYMLDFNRGMISDKFTAKYGTDVNEPFIRNSVEKEIERVYKLCPLKIQIVREDYRNDKEALKIESVQDKNGDDLPIVYFSLKIQSMNESDTYWLDTGSFSNLNIQIN